MSEKLDKANQSIRELIDKICSEKHSELLKQGRCPHWSGLETPPGPCTSGPGECASCRVKALEKYRQGLLEEYLVEPDTIEVYWIKTKGTLRGQCVKVVKHLGNDLKVRTLNKVATLPGSPDDYLEFISNIGELSRSPLHIEDPEVLLRRNLKECEACGGIGFMDFPIDQRVLEDQLCLECYGSGYVAGLPVNILGRGVILDNGDPVIVGVDDDGKFVVKVDDVKLKEE